MASRKPVKPARMPSGATESRRTNMLLEKLRSEFKAFRDGLKSLGKRLDILEPTLGQVSQDTSLLITWSRQFSLDLKTVQTDVSMLKTDLAVLKTDVAVLKTDVSEMKNDLKDVKGRLTTVETQA